MPSVVRLHALRVPLVAGTAGSGRAACSAGPALTTALAVQSSAVAARRGVAGGRGVAGARARPDGGAGDGEGTVAAIDAEGDIWVVSAVGTGESHKRAGVSVATAGDADLEAADVVLGLADVRAMDT